MVSENRVHINSIYYAIEGEGIFIGTPTIFLRLQGCQLRCDWCDSKETWDKLSGEYLLFSEAIERLNNIAKQLNLKRVSLTGGNPLEFENVLDLVSDIIKNDFYINIEVDGQVFKKEVFDKVNFISSDYKTKSSGVKQKEEVLIDLINNYGNKKLQIKAVIKNKDDLDDFILFSEKFTDFLNFVVTPAWEGEKLDLDLIEMVQRTISGTKIRMICQQHKLIWGVSIKNI